MNFEKYLRALAPYCVGWYAIASVLDAMFYSMTGLSFFVGDVNVRLGLTVLDAGGAWLLHVLLAKGEAASAGREYEARVVAIEAARKYMEYTCAPVSPPVKNTFLYDYLKHGEATQRILSGEVFTANSTNNYVQRSL